VGTSVLEPLRNLETFLVHNIKNSLSQDLVIASFVLDNVLEHSFLKEKLAVLVVFGRGVFTDENLAPGETSQVDILKYGTAIGGLENTDK